MRPNNEIDEYDDFDIDDTFTPLSNDRDPYETDEDYEERMHDLYGDDWNMQ